MDSDSLKLFRFIPAIFHHGGSKPEVVLPSDLSIKLQAVASEPGGRGAAALLK